MRSSLLLPLLPLLGACAEAAAPGAGDASRRGLTPPPPYAAPALPDEPEFIAAIRALDGITVHDVTSVYDGSTALSLSITQPGPG
jgi:hypothetical protein